MNLNILPFSPLAFFAKIASLQGATSGIQFKSPEAGYFSPKSPISPKSPFSPKSPASKGPLLASNSNRQRLVIFHQNRQFHQNRHFRQNRQPPRGHFWHPIQIARGWLFFAKIAIFAKIASLQGATSGIQFKSPEAGDFSPFSPFSPLPAFLDISAYRTVKVFVL